MSYVYREGNITINFDTESSYHHARIDFLDYQTVQPERMSFITFIRDRMYNAETCVVESITESMGQSSSGQSMSTMSSSSIGRSQSSVGASTSLNPWEQSGIIAGTWTDPNTFANTNGSFTDPNSSHFGTSFTFEDLQNGIRDVGIYTPYIPLQVVPPVSQSLPPKQKQVKPGPPPDPIESRYQILDIKENGEDADI